MQLNGKYARKLHPVWLPVEPPGTHFFPVPAKILAVQSMIRAWQSCDDDVG